MLHSIYKNGAYILLAASLLISPLAQSADKPIDEQPTSRDEILRLIDVGLPEPLRGDIGALVKQMMAARIGPPLSQTFDPKLAIARLLGRGARLAPDCRQLFTRSGDPDRLPCVASVGSADGAGAYRYLGFSKHMALGNVSYFDRPADREIGIGELVPIKMTDEEANLVACRYLEANFGLTMDEVPVPPADAKNPFPVRTIAMAALDEGGRVNAVEVEKLVMIRRGLFTGLGGNFDWIPAPGTAMVALDDLGVRQASIREWQALSPNPDVDPANAKTLAELKNDIADDLVGLMRGPVDRILIGLVFTSTAPTNDKELNGLLLPAVQISVSSVPADLDEAQQEELANTQVSTASIIREFPLVNFPAETKGDN